MSKQHEFIEIIQKNNDIFEEYNDVEEGGFFSKLRKPKYTKEDVYKALMSTQNAIDTYIVYDENTNKYKVGTLSFWFVYDEENEDTNIIFDIPTEFMDSFQLISFELDRIFPEPMQGSWLVTTHKIVVSDDTVTLYNHTENFSYDILCNVFNKNIINMSLEEVTLLQYVLSWIAIVVEFEDKNTTREDFIEILKYHEYDDVNYYTEDEFREAIEELL